MENEDFIEVDCYEGGRWITRRYPLSVALILAEQLLRSLPHETAVNLIRRLMASLGAHESSLPRESQEARLKVLVE